MLIYRKLVPQQLGDAAAVLSNKEVGTAGARRHGSQSHGLIIFAVRVLSAVVYLYLVVKLVRSNLGTCFPFSMIMLYFALERKDSPKT